MKKMSLWVLSILVCSSSAFAAAQLDVLPGTILRDQVAKIRVRGLSAHQTVTVRARTQDATSRYWSSWATFTADGQGRVNLAQDTPTAGTYAYADAQGLIWSLAIEQSVDPTGEYFSFPPDQQLIQLTVESNGTTIATSQLTVDMIDDQEVLRTPVSGQPFVATYYSQRDNHRHPAVIVLGGSSGANEMSNDRAAMLSSHGFAALALQYFGEPTLPTNLDRLPLEYFKAAIDWLKAQPGVKPSEIFVMGLSKGAEASLILASTYPQDIHGAVAISGSSFGWQGIIPPTFTPVFSSWTLGGTEVPFLPFVFAPGDFDQFPIRLLPIYQRSIGTANETSAAAIQVEKINGPVLMVSSGDDQLWPAEAMSELVIKRLKDHHFGHFKRHLAYPGAGHLVFTPMQSTSQNHIGPYVIGGTSEITGRATRESWRKIVAFLTAATRNACSK